MLIFFKYHSIAKYKSDLRQIVWLIKNTGDNFIDWYLYSWQLMKY